MQLTNLLNDFLKERQSTSDEKRAVIVKDRIKNKTFKFSPSSVAKCSREVVYAMLGYPKTEIPTRVLRIFDNGDSMHERYQNWFGEMGILISPELEIYDEDLGVSGRTDALIRLDNELILVELKSANWRAFERMQKTREPKEDYVLQLQLYLHLTGIEKGIILIENKNDQSILEFAVTYDIDIANKLIHKINKCLDHARNGALPERDYEKSSFECKYCDFNTLCWSN